MHPEHRFTLSNTKISSIEFHHASLWWQHASIVLAFNHNTVVTFPSITNLALSSLDRFSSDSSPSLHFCTIFCSTTEAGSDFLWFGPFSLRSRIVVWFRPFCSRIPLLQVISAPRLLHHIAAPITSTSFVLLWARSFLLRNPKVSSFCQSRLTLEGGLHFHNRRSDRLRHNTSFAYHWVISSHQLNRTNNTNTHTSLQLQSDCIKPSLKADLRSWIPFTFALIYNPPKAIKTSTTILHQRKGFQSANPREHRNHAYDLGCRGWCQGQLRSTRVGMLQTLRSWQRKPVIHSRDGSLRYQNLWSSEWENC